MVVTVVWLPKLPLKLDTAEDALSEKEWLVFHWLRNDAGSGGCELWSSTLRVPNFDMKENERPSLDFLRFGVEDPPRRCKNHPHDPASSDTPL
mmetsp:Transcript_6418/g.14956  ORF Transcript_6418/g.14956 Transcript_6418/m.14956 type:complete len:93 (+) Transcript_6418:483-761(+)